MEGSVATAVVSPLAKGNTSFHVQKHGPEAN